MTKYKLLMIIMIFNIVTVIFANQIDTLSYNNAIITGAVPTEANQLEYAWGLLKTYFDLLSFQVNGMPTIIYMFFLPLQIPFAFLLGELVISAVKALPFT